MRLKRKCSVLFCYVIYWEYVSTKQIDHNSIKTIHEQSGLNQHFNIREEQKFMFTTFLKMLQNISNFWVEINFSKVLIINFEKYMMLIVKNYMIIISETISL